MPMPDRKNEYNYCALNNDCEYSNCFKLGLNSIFFFFFLLCFTSYFPYLYGQNTSNPIPLNKSSLCWKEGRAITTDSSINEIHEFISPAGLPPFFKVDPTSSSFGEIVLANLDGVYYFDGHRLRASAIPGKHLKQTLGQIIALDEEWLCLVNKITDSVGFISDLLFFNEKTHVIGSLADYCPSSGTLLSSPITQIQKVSPHSLFVQTRDNQYYILSQDSVQSLAINKEYHYLGTWQESAILIRNTKDTKEVLLVDAAGEKTRPIPPIPSPFPARHVKTADSVLYFAMHELLGRKVYSIDLKKGSLFSADWKVHQIPSDLIFQFSTNRGLLFNDARHNRGMVLTHDGWVHNDFFTQITNHLDGNNPLAQIKTDHCPESTNLLATERGIIRVFEKEKYTKKKPHLLSKTGFSSRQMALSPDKQSIWLTSYSGTYHLDLNKIPDSLSYLPIPEKLRRNLPAVTYNSKLTKEGGLFLSGRYIIAYSKEKDSCFLYTNPAPDIRMLFGLEETQNGDFLIGTTKGVFLLPSGEWDEGLLPVSFTSETADTTRASSFLYTHRIKRLSQTDSLFICAKDGLYFCRFIDEAAPKLRVLEYVAKADVHDAHLLDDGTLLLATEHEGLLWLDATKERKLKHRFDKSNHLQSNFTHNILQDSQERIWLSSNHGLYLIDLEKKNIRTLGEKNGFPSDEFNRISSLRISDSLFVFGGINGVTFFDPNDFSAAFKHKDIGIHKVKVLLDSQLFILSPSSSNHGLPHFDIPAEAQYLLPVAESQSFPYVYPLQYRFTRDSTFWKSASRGRIPLTKAMRKEPLEIRWQLDGNETCGAKFLVSTKERSRISYIVLGVPFLVLFFLTVFFWRRSKIRRGPERASDPVISPSSTETDEQQKEPIRTKRKYAANRKEALLKELREKERKNYYFQRDISSQLLKESIAIIKSDMSKAGFSVDYLAEKNNLSTRQFHRRIQEETGLTPNALISLIRMREAKKILLSDTKITMTELAGKVGYNNPNYFSKKFKDFYGYAPKQLSQIFLKLGKATDE